VSTRGPLWTLVCSGSTDLYGDGISFIRNIPRSLQQTGSSLGRLVRLTCPNKHNGINRSLINNHLGLGLNTGEWEEKKARQPYGLYKRDQLKEPIGPSPPFRENGRVRRGNNSMHTRRHSAPEAADPRSTVRLAATAAVPLSLYSGSLVTRVSPEGRRFCLVLESRLACSALQGPSYQGHEMGSKSGASFRFLILSPSPNTPLRHSNVANTCVMDGWVYFHPTPRRQYPPIWDSPCPSIYQCQSPRADMKRCVGLLSFNSDGLEQKGRIGPDQCR
jgi:hypothetical protein